MKALLFVLAVAPRLHADESVAPSGCRAQLERARAALLAQGFAPAGDTPAALQVEGDNKLSLFVAASADGLHESFELNIDEVAQRRTLPWRRHSRPICCDDQAEEEDHVTEVTWLRQRGNRRAQITTVTGRYPRRSQWVKQFTEAARQAADACLG